MHRTISLALALITFTTAHAQPANNLINKVPDWANALVVVDLKNILASPIAQREGWDRLTPAEVLGGSIPYPNNTDLALLAAHLEPGSLKSQRDLALIQGGPFLAQADMAKLEKRRAEEIVAGVSAILTPKNSYIVSLTPKQLAVISPANRQDTSRWIRFAQGNAVPALSNYLQQAHASIAEGYHIVVAIDLHDAIDPHLAKRFLSLSPLLKGKNVDLDALVKVLASSRGIRIGIRFDQNIKATFAGDFGENIKPFAALLPGLVLSTLDDMGGELEEFPVANAAIQDKSFLITSTLTLKGLQKVMTLVPPISGPVLAGREMPKGVPVENAVAGQQRYFKTIREIANDAHTSADKKNDMVLAAQGYERAASRIDQLAVAGVDDELVKFSTFASSKLRAIADVLRNCVLEATAIQSGRKVNVQVIPGFYTGYTLGPWNPQNPGDPYSPSGLYIRPTFTPPNYIVRTNDSELQARQAVIIANGAKQRLELWRQLTDETANLRKKLSIKYKIDF